MGVVLLCLVIFFGSLEAAAPATHVHFAQIWLGEESDPNSLIAGTLFPDIRYLGTIARKKTHEKGVTLELIQHTPSPFKKGMRLHAYLDEQRERFIKNSGIFLSLQFIPKELRVLFLKILEDEILWDQVDIERALEALQSIYPEQIAAGVDELTIQQWHASLIDYFQQRPSLFFQKLAKENQGFLQADASTLDEWSTLLPLYAADPRFISYTEQMLRYCTKSK